MESYNNFIGIDIGKFSFVVSHLGNKKTDEFNNDDSGIALFIKHYSSQLETSFIVLEVTGGYEMLLLLGWLKTTEHFYFSLSYNILI